MIDPIDQFIIEQTTRKPARVWNEGTVYLKNAILPVLQSRTKLPEHMVIYAVNSARGFAYFKDRRITVPSWAFSKFKPSEPDYVRKNIEHIQWYLAHEIAHIANYIEFGPNHDNHGPNFMRHLIRICPPNATRFETGYKPRNSKAAGITEIDIKDL